MSATGEAIGHQVVNTVRRKMICSVTLDVKCRSGYKTAGQLNLAQLLPLH